MPTPRIKVGWIVTFSVALATVGGFLWFKRNQKPAEVKWTTSKVEKGRLVAKVTATGTLSALVTVQVGAQVSGRIKEINVDFNSPVKKGQVIARIDPQLFVAAEEQAKANYLAAQGNLAKAKAQAVDAERQYGRNNELRGQKLVAQADLDTSQANMEAAKAQVTASEGALEQAKANLHQSQINLDYTTISAPVSGTVISRAVDVGQTVAAAFQAPTLFTIAEDLKKMQVDTSVAEADVGKLSAGMKASFTVDAYPTERFMGTVRQIRNAPTTVQNVVTYDAVIDVDNSELKLKPGMTANVTFVYAEKDDVLRVPNAAMRFRPPPSVFAASGGAAQPGEGGPARVHGAKHELAPDQRTVWLLRDGKPKPVPIKIGVSDGTNTEIADGDVHSGDAVITEAQAPDAKGGPPGAPPGGSPFRRGF
jgi:HlyD family secretion protein